MEQVDGSHGFIAVAEGVFHYLLVSDVKTLVAELSHRYPRGRLVFDGISPKVADRSEQTMRAHGNQSARVLFRLKDPHAMKQRDHVSHCAIDYDVSGCLSKSQRRQLPLLFRVLYLFFRRAKAIYFVRLDFADDNSPTSS